MTCTAPECCPAPALFVPPGGCRGRRFGCGKCPQNSGLAMLRAPTLRSLALVGILTAGAAAAAEAQRPSPAQPGLLRVCNDPDNMPFSNQKEEGFENKLARLIAKDWGSRLEYVWYPTRRGYFRILNGMYCDLIIQAPGGLDMAGTTKPYYRSGYVFLTRQDGKLADIQSLADPRL